MYSKFNVEKDTYNAALVYHNLTNDTEVQRILAETEAKVPQEIKDRIVECLTNPCEEETQSFDDYDVDVGGDLSNLNLHIGVELGTSHDEDLNMHS